ncbi:hypothetical protein UFOVP1324_44 [uncultured Caudovirales phage]|uniref:Uncharacterized protein n=1 Tax=uncultured Caudovirales phage TaxID=2100421 RepID=A0A6J5RWV8_9CAUD|nr:hypothetical protein UFOVP1324_44 [uncultured Caudovirales phage]
MAYDDQEKWALPAKVGTTKRHEIVKGRKLGEGHYEGLAAIYVEGRLVAQAALLAPTRTRAVRGARQLARGLA